MTRREGDGMAELVWCRLCGWRNLELREAVCDEQGNLICVECGTILKEAG